MIYVFEQGGVVCGVVWVVCVVVLVLVVMVVFGGCLLFSSKNKYELVKLKDVQ